MGRNRRLAIAAVLAAAVSMSSSTAGAVPSRPGPCELTRGADESVRHFAGRLIRCAVATWDVPGGADKALCIAARESGLHPGAQSATGRYLGLYQHSAKYWPGRYESWTEPDWGLDPSALSGRTNAIVTMRMVHASGWGPWKGIGC